MSMGIIESGKYNKVAGLGGGSGEVIIHDPSKLTWRGPNFITPDFSTGGLVEKDGIIQFIQTAYFSESFPVKTKFLICNGLPKPAVPIEATISWDSWDSAIIYGSLHLDTEGALYAIINTDARDLTGIFNIMYIKAAED